MNWTYAYNPSTQLTNVTRSNDLYAWNGHFNVIRAYGTNGLNQLTSAGGTALGYDTRGNLTSSGGQGSSYHSLNQLSTAPGVTYLYYEPAGQLDQVYLPSGTWTNLLYEGSSLTTEYQNNTLTILRRSFHGPGQDEPVVWYEGAGPPLAPCL